MTDRPSPLSQNPEPSALPEAGASVQANWEGTAKVAAADAIALTGLGMMVKAVDGNALAASAEQASPVAGLAHPPLSASAKPTTGEEKFERRTYGLLTGVGIFLLSGAILNYVKTSPQKAWFGLGNKSWAQAWLAGQEGFAKAGIWTQLRKNLGERTWLQTEALKNTAEILQSTAALFMGGNLALGYIIPRELHKKEIVAKLNAEHGQPGEVEQGNANIDAKPKQSALSVIAGRVAAFTTVTVAWFSSAAIVRAIAKNHLIKEPESAWAQAAAEDGLKAYSKWMGRRFQAGGDALSARTGLPRTSAWAKIGDALALDAFATTAALLLLKGCSSLIAGWREKKTGEPAPLDSTGETKASNAPLPLDAFDAAPERASFAAHLAPREAAKPRTESYAAQATQDKAQRRAEMMVG